MTPPPPLDRATLAWLLHLADPGRQVAPAAPLPAVEPLLSLAEAHGVLPTVMARLPAERRAAAAAARRPVLEALAAQAMLLTQTAQALTRSLEAAGVRALVVKGPAFASRLYKAPCWRPFTDIDLLLDRADFPAAGRALEAAGWAPEGIELKHAAEHYGEEKWVRRVAGVPVLLELHWDMIGSPTLRQGRRVDLALLAGAGESPAALLLVAAVHAAYGHAFDRLQPLVDVAQAARGVAGPLDVPWLAARLREGGLGPGVALALDLAGRCFREPACPALRQALGLRRPPLSQRWLMTPAVVAGAEAAQHRRLAWRRQLTREWLKRAR